EGVGAHGAARHVERGGAGVHHAHGGPGSPPERQGRHPGGRQVRRPGGAGGGPSRGHRRPPASRLDPPRRAGRPDLRAVGPGGRGETVTLHKTLSRYNDRYTSLGPATKITLNDCTLREGEQSPIVNFQSEQKLTVARRLVE